MIPLDYHVHSTHSFDAEHDLPTMCEAALARGLREIAFTEHFDFDRRDPAYGYFDYARYAAAVADARARYAGRLTIRLGLEFDFRRAYGTQVGDVLAAWDFDVLIGSVHSACGVPLFRLSREVPPDLDLDALYEEYFAEVEALVTSGWCHVVGHFDYLYKHVPSLAAPKRTAAYWQRVERLLALYVRGGVALEVNLHHVVDRGLGMAADAEILRRYAALGGRLVTVGSDAHHAPEVGAGFDRAERALREAGLTHVTGYARGRPYAVPLA